MKIDFFRKNIYHKEVQPQSKDTDLIGFARRLKAARKEKKFSQGELAELVGFHFQHLSRYERGLAKPGIDAIKRLAQALDLTTEYLLEGTSSAEQIQKVDPEMSQRLLEIETLPADDKETVKKLLDAFILRKKIQDLKAI